MRLLHVNHQAGFQGGVERILYDTARSLSEMGWPQALLSEQSVVDSDYTTPFEVVGTDWQIVEKFNPDLVLIHKCVDPQLIERFTSQYKTVAMVHDHDLVCMRRHKYFPIGSKICDKPAGINCYSHLCFVQKSEVDAIMPVKFVSLRSQKRILASFRNVNTFIVGSGWMRQSLLVNGFDPGRVSIIHPIPASIADVKPVPAVCSSGSILFVGQVIRGKGVDLMLRALANLAGDWHADFAGDGNHLAECKALAQSLGIDNKLTFHGWVEHEKLNDLYRRARFTVVPSRWPEPFGMVGIEAMARGRAVVGFDAGGICEWLVDGQYGYLVSEADIPGLTRAMQKLLDDSDLAARLGNNARQRVADRFTHQIYIKEMVQLLEGV